MSQNQNFATSVPNEQQVYVAPSDADAPPQNTEAPYDVVVGNNTTNEQPKVTFTINFNDPYWYLKRIDDLEAVTSERTNLKIGLINIIDYPVNQNQIKAGIVAKVSVKTICGDFNNISVFLSRNGTESNPAYRLVMPENVVGEGENAKRYRYFFLDSKISAQVLSYISAKPRVAINPAR